MVVNSLLQDLQYLSEGLEGRSKNPVALLFDTLMQPNEDIGESHPPSLNWALESHKAISHMVLGRGEAGGSWHRMKPDVLSLSTARWLQLPIYGFEEWSSADGIVEGEGEGSVNSRVALGSVAKYYKSYVEKTRISENFRNGVTVTQVQVLCPVAEKKHRSRSCDSNFSSVSMCSSQPEHTPLSPERRTCSGQVSRLANPTGTSKDEEEEGEKEGEEKKEEGEGEEEGESSSDDESENVAACDSDDTGISCCPKRVCLSPEGCCWVVRGRRLEEDGSETPVSVCARNVVLATGVNDDPKKLNVPGEDLNYVQHTFSRSTQFDVNSDHPVLVVGAGLVAADTVLHALSSGLTVVHAFHQDPLDQRLIYHTMDPKVYSEYVTLFHKMCGKSTDPNYTPLPQHRVQRFNTDRVCTLHDVKNDTTRSLTVSVALVVIGGQAQLDFLPESVSHQLGLKHDQPIEAKRNPVDVDPYTFESEVIPSLYAMGPLVGDNFVRFALGGAIGINKHLRKLFCRQ